MEIVVLERLLQNSKKVHSRVRADKIILNITSEFDGNSQMSELLFRISEQKVLKIIHEETAVGKLDTSSIK